MSTETVSGPRPDTAARLPGLDALRAVALGLGIVLHSLMPFLPGTYWPTVDSQSSDAAGAVINGIHLFRMVLFMALAGFFGRMVLQRRGTRAYLRDRGLRILLPFLAFWPFALGSLVGVSVLDQAVRGTAMPEIPIPPDVPLVLLILTPGHLWFLNVLVQCVVITVTVRFLAVRLFGPDRLARWTGRLGGVLSAPLGVLLAAVPYAVSLLLQQTPPSWGIETPYTVLPTVSSLLAYLGAFLVGWSLQARPDALERIARYWPVQLVTAVVLTVVSQLVATAPTPVLAPLVALAGWTWTFGLIGAATRFLRRENPVVRYLADSSYRVYLLHLPILIAVQVFLADLSWPIPVKVVLAWIPTVAGLLLSYDLLVRGTWLGAWLGGRRRAPVLRRS